MLVVEVFRGEGGEIVGLRARGHAGWARHGQDIVCAGASAILQAAVLGIIRHLGLPARLQAGDGYLELRLETGGGAAVQTPEAWGRAQAVLETAVLGIDEIARQYARHVRLVQRHGGESDDHGT
ncbi:MAG: ribosomal-processing cysteine protease Prp [Firmicutes bacterium]|nr:ribosomal-processing cysteine protease Prp [Bacillota bacterium]